MTTTTTPAVQQVHIHYKAERIKEMIPFLSKDWTRQPLWNLAVRGEYLYATDGHKAIRLRHKLIWGEDSGLVDGGVYKPVKDGRDWILIPVSDVQYPQAEIVMKRPEKPEFEIGGETGSSIGNSKMLFLLARQGAGICVDYKHIEALPDGYWDVCGTTPTSSIFFKCGEDMEAVIMPCRA